MNRTIFTSIFVLLMLANLSAQRISDLTVEGIPSLTPLGTFNPTNNSTTNPGVGQMIFPASANLSNVNVSILAGTGVITPNPLPSDWSTTVTGITVTDPVTTNWAKYNITLKKINPVTLPFDLRTGESGVFNSDVWTPATLGWAGACIDKSQSIIRFGGAKRSFVVAFSDSPDSLYYTIKFLATPWNNGNVFNVDGSADGLHWTSIMQYDATNPMPLSSPSVVTGLKIAPDCRYVRWVYTTRAGSNVSLENIKITKSNVAALDTPERSTSLLIPDFAGNYLRIKSDNIITQIRMYSETGLLVKDEKLQANTISIGTLPKGMYVVKLMADNGRSRVLKFVKF